MMSSASEHHAKAEELLGQVRKEQDSIRRGWILAEAQVHATLALADAASARTTPISEGREDHTLYGFDPDPGHDPEE
jgi:hypothetical protein